MGTMLPSMAMILASGGGLLAGLLAGLFGIGGGALVVPVLMLLGASIHQATALGLIYIVFSSFSGSISHWRAGNIRFDLTALLALSAAFSALLGVKLSLIVPRQGLAGLFVCFMILVLVMFAIKGRMSTERSPVTGTKYWLGALFTGGIAGLLAGLLGVGGGLIMVPLLVLINGLDLKQATGTSLASVCLIGLTSAAEHYIFGGLGNSLAQFWPQLLLMSLLGIAGAPIGAELNKRLPESVLKTGFIMLCLSVMSYMLWQLF